MRSMLNGILVLSHLLLKIIVYSMINRFLAHSMLKIYIMIIENVELVLVRLGK